MDETCDFTSNISRLVYKTNSVKAGGEIRLYNFGLRAAGRIAKDEVVRAGLVQCGGKSAVHDLVIRRVKSVGGGALLALLEFGILIFIEQHQVHVRGFIADHAASVIGYKRL